MQEADNVSDPKSDPNEEDAEAKPWRRHGKKPPRNGRRVPTSNYKALGIARLLRVIPDPLVTVLASG